ncbi:MAG: enoyl-CoA hydratase/isomerase family protein [Phycisphaerae bacterium]|nr:enoyl-CoA hydratase/isomerase family protein [Phycisphaerae bacterium]
MMKLNTKTRSWTIHVDPEWVAWLVFNLPGEKVNKLTATAMAELDETLDELAADERIKAVAIRSEKQDSFIVGADINELLAIASVAEARTKSELGQRIFAKIAALEVPTVAVIHGACMGGGLELALACDYRLVSDHPKTSLAVPEVNLGILPGWGGTQRLPRLLALPVALKMMLAGKPMSGRAARRVGLADGAVTPAFLADQTRRFVDGVLTPAGVRRVRRRRRRAQRDLLSRLGRTPLGRRFILHRARKDVLNRTHGVYPAPLEIVDVVGRTLRRRLEPAHFAAEAEAFSRLAVTAISRNLVGLFLGSQRMKRRVKGGPDRPMTAAGVVGAGIMGGGIAWALARAGLRVRMKDINWPAVNQGTAAAAGMFKSLVDRRKMTKGAMNLAMHRITGTIDWRGFRPSDIVIEAVVENLKIKHQVLTEIETHVPPTTIIATNTSSLSLRALATPLQHPRRFVGLHFFNPVNRMQLVEVIAGKKTSRDTVLAAAELVRRMGKLPIVVGDCPGFLVNRILLPYLIESTWMFEEGVTTDRIDHALERFGMPMGPLRLVDEVGIDTGYKVAKELESAYGERMHVASVLGDVVDAGTLLGKKSGRGFYLYDNGTPRPNDDANALVSAARERDGVAPIEVTDADIVDRAVLIMVNEAARCLDEGVVDDPELLDMAMVMGTGFAPFRGGLLRYADERGIERVHDRLEELADRYGERFRPAGFLQKLAKRGRRFHAAR